MVSVAFINLSILVFSFISHYGQALARRTLPHTLFSLRVVLIAWVVPERGKGAGRGVRTHEKWACYVAFKRLNKSQIISSSKNRWQLTNGKCSVR
jgi:hypothetical protein